MGICQWDIRVAEIGTARVYRLPRTWVRRPSIHRSIRRCSSRTRASFRRVWCGSTRSNPHSRHTEYSMPLSEKLCPLYWYVSFEYPGSHGVGRRQTGGRMENLSLCGVLEEAPSRFNHRVQVRKSSRPGRGRSFTRSSPASPTPRRVTDNKIARYGSRTPCWPPWGAYWHHVESSSNCALANAVFRSSPGHTNEPRWLCR